MPRSLGKRLQCFSSKMLHNGWEHPRIREPEAWSMLPTFAAPSTIAGTDVKHSSLDRLCEHEVSIIEVEKQS